MMTKKQILGAGLGLGAAIMYFGDPDRGRRRRAVTASLLTAVAGGALALYGMRRRGMAGAALGALGFSLFTRGLTNLEMGSLAGYGGGREISVDVKLPYQPHDPAARRTAAREV